MGWFEDNGYAPTMDEQQGPQPYAPPTADPRTPGTPVQGKPGFWWNYYGGMDTYAPGTNPNAPQPGSAQPAPPQPQTAPTDPAQTYTLEGFNQDKLNNADHNTPKYVVARILQKYPHTPEGLAQAMPELKAAFPNISSDGKQVLSIPGVGSWDVIRDVQGGGKAWQWNTLTNADGSPYTDSSGSGGGGSLGAPGTMNTLGAPGFGGTGGGNAFSLGSATTGGGGSYGGSAPQFQTLSAFQAPTVPDAATPFTPSSVTAQGAYREYQAPSAFSYDRPVPGTYTGTAPLNAAKAAPTLAEQTAFTYDPLKTSEAFKLPTGQEALDQDPGYGFRLNQGLGALENSAAAKGILRTGGTYKGLIDYGQNAASQEYQNAYGRARDTYGLNQSVKQSEQGQQFGQSLSAQQQNEAQKLAKFNAELAGQGQEFQQAATQQSVNEAQNLAAYNANLTGQNQGYTQAANTAQMNATNAFNAAGLNSANYNAGADRELAANQQNNAFGLSAAQFNAGQTQQQFENAFNAANTAYGYANQQNLAANAQAMQGYQTDTNANISQQQLNQGWQQLGLTAQQQAFSQSLSAQQQQWMQAYMERGQTWDEAYRQMMARLQYA